MERNGAESFWECRDIGLGDVFFQKGPDTPKLLIIKSFWKSRPAARAPPGASHVIHFPTREAAIVIDPGNGDLINELLHNHLEIIKDILDDLEVNPNFALISVGSNNNDRHPFLEVVEAIVTHDTHPHLFCTQMTGQCRPGENIKEKIDAFYEKEMEEGDYEITKKVRPANGIPCAGTIRVTFDGKTGSVSSAPPPLVHSSMLKTLFKPSQLLCGARFPG